MKHILVTRPQGKGDELVSNLQAASFKVSHTPVLGIHYVTPSTIELATLNEAEIIIFISQDAVLGLKSCLAQLPTTATCIAVGSTTAEALYQHFAVTALVPEQHDTEGMLALSALQQVEQKPVVIIKGQGGRPDLAKQLKIRGALLNQCVVYERVALAENANDWLDHWQHSEIDGIVVTSIAAVDAIFNSHDSPKLSWLRTRQFVVASARIATHLQQHHAVAPELCQVSQGAGDEAMFIAVLAARNAMQTSVADEQTSELDAETELSQSSEPHLAIDESLNAQETSLQDTALSQPEVASQHQDFSAAPARPSLEHTMSEQSSAPVSAAVVPATQKISKLAVLALLVGITGLAASGALVWQGQQSVSYLQAQLQQQANDNAALQQQLAAQQQQLAGFKSEWQNAQRSVADTLAAERQQLSAQIAAWQENAAAPNQLLLQSELTYLARLLPFKVTLEQDWQGALTVLQRMQAIAETLPQSQPLQVAISQDINQLRAKPNAPVEAHYIALQALQQQAAKLPLLQLALPQPAAVEGTELSPQLSDWRANLARSWQRLVDDFIKIRTRESATIAPLLNDTEQRLLRHELSIHLSTAQAALLEKQASVFFAALNAAHAHLQTHYDSKDTAVQSVLAELQRLAGITLHFDTNLELASPAVVRGL
ncbi:uroporphyrinogen-III C-methyltransferase [Pseudoalteromonas fenneropenaei]|uniref:Uroporphyrinogen-III C-methyltransferase n=1 Tax=Pseudoalteromonas fenneropenaei TaxID=1737459 RepID=A0ABV7CPP4_9GAMM